MSDFNVFCTKNRIENGKKVNKKTVKIIHWWENNTEKKLIKSFVNQKHIFFFLFQFGSNMFYESTDNRSTKANVQQIAGVKLGR